MDYYNFYTNRAKRTANMADKRRFLKMAEKYKTTDEQVVECVEECEVQIVEHCSITVEDKPKRGRKKKEKSE